MVLVAGVELMQRQDGGLAAGWPTGSATRRCCWSGGLATLYAAAVVDRPVALVRAALRAADPRHGAGQYADQHQSGAADVDRGRRAGAGAIEARIALGATRLQAFSGLLRRALRTATTPLLNTMAVAGVVTLPGMMAGQILAGADPGEAAKYQIMIMFVLAGASGLGAFAAALGSVLLMTDARHRLRLDRTTVSRKIAG